MSQTESLKSEKLNQEIETILDSEKESGEIEDYTEEIEQGELVENILKWKCNICKSVNAVEYKNQTVEIVNNNISGLGECKGLCSMKIKVCCVHLPDNECQSFLGYKKQRTEDESDE